MERYVKPCNFHRTSTGKELDCPHSVYNFVRDNKLPGDEKQFKFLKLISKTGYYGK
jgi:hypothetical protein